MLVGSLAMMRAAYMMRVQIGPARFSTPPAGVALVFSGFALLGMSLVLLLRSPFRMSPPERLLRIVWLGPIGRGFVWLATRGARTRRAPAPEVIAVAPPLRRDRVAVVRPARSASVVSEEALGALEARVAELERWRDGG